MENKRDNEYHEKPYNSDAQYSFSSRNSTSRGYNLNGTYYESTSNYEDYADVESKGQEYESRDRDTQNYGAGIYGQNTYTSGAQGMVNNSIPPLDKKGRPLKNKFASRLAWGIILIIGSFLFGFGMVPVYIATILSIIAIVFAFQQNVAYTQGEWDTYKRKAKTSGILLWIAGIIIMIWIAILIVAGAWLYKEYSVRSEMKDLFNLHQDYTYTDTTEDPDVHEETFRGKDDKFEYKNGTISKPENFNVFTIEGKEISVPLSLKELQNAGFQLKDKALNETIDPQDYKIASFYTKDDRFVGQLTISNYADKKIKVKDGIIDAVTITNIQVADVSFIDGLRLCESTVEDAMNIFGSDYDLKSEYDNRISIRWKYTTGYEKSIELSFEDGKLYYADIRNGKNIE